MPEPSMRQCLHKTKFVTEKGSHCGKIDEVGRSCRPTNPKIYGYWFLVSRIFGTQQIKTSLICKNSLSSALSLTKIFLANTIYSIVGGWIVEASKQDLKLTIHCHCIYIYQRKRKEEGIWKYPRFDLSKLGPTAYASSPTCQPNVGQAQAKGICPIRSTSQCLNKWLNYIWLSSN